MINHDAPFFSDPDYANPRGQYGPVVERTCRECHCELADDEGAEFGYYADMCTECEAEDREHDRIMDEVAAVMDVYYEVTRAKALKGDA